MKLRACDWTPDEDAHLLRLYLVRVPHREMAKRLSAAHGRQITVASLEHRLNRLRARDAALVDHAPRALPPLDYDDENGAKTDPCAEPYRNGDNGIEIPISVEEPQSNRSVARVQRGPATSPHYIPAGHELGGVSRLTDGRGNTKAEWSKTRVAGAEEPPTAVPESFLLDRASVMQRGDGTTVVQWSSYKKDELDRWEACKAAVQAHVAEYARAEAPVAAPDVFDADRLVAYPIGDPHIGMLAWAAEVGENFDLKIAERELVECMRQLIARSPSTGEAIVCNLGDFWHAQDDSQRTPKNGNKLDVDGRFGKVGKIGLSIFRSVVDAALEKHTLVRVRSIPGNHDPTSALWLPMLLQETYRDEPRVVVEDGCSPYQYDVFGKVLLGWAHGDGAKLEDLGEIMATDQPEKWGAASFRYWNTGHIHHWTQKELRGCVVDTHRTLAGRDAWHHHSGYRAGRALKAVTYHREYGLDSVVVVGIERVRSALRGAAA